MFELGSPGVGGRRDASCLFSAAMRIFPRGSPTVLTSPLLEPLISVLQQPIRAISQFVEMKKNGSDEAVVVGQTPTPRDSGGHI